MASVTGAKSTCDKSDAMASLMRRCGWKTNPKSRVTRPPWPSSLVSRSLTREEAPHAEARMRRAPATMATCVAESTASFNDLTANVTWATVPDAYISASSVNQHVSVPEVNHFASMYAQGAI